ncbi:uncharacterized protein LOC114847001 [Betta splendens]|uniref:Uncharacterized protein LOC114847001 n=1 Tax=Betta splendens TaxID=158456 RepID=A0A9W2XGK0_BETSP|nr:uncharacterized protein LOC114847001 [Betta splendens]
MKEQNSTDRQGLNPLQRSHFSKLMNALRLLLVLLAACASECSVKHNCEDYDMESFLLLEGEAFYFVPYIVKYLKQPLNVTWYKNASKVEFISADVKDRVHYQDSALFLLDLVPEDSGVYVARIVEPSGQCSNAFLNVTVFKTSYKNNSDVFYGKIQTSDTNQMLSCPQIVKKTCDDLKGNFTWYKDFSLIKGEHQNLLRVNSAAKHHEGVYTCVCSWTRNGKVHVSSGSRKLNIKEPIHGVEFIFPDKHNPVTKAGRVPGLEFIPNKHEQLAEEGSELKLNCSVSCEAKDKTCRASWDVSEPMDGYKQTTEIATDPSHNITAVLTIAKVSDKDFETEFQCVTSKASTTVTLKRKGSVVPMVLRGLCVLLFCLVAAVLVRCFALDLALVFRPCFPGSSRSKDMKLYDAYVVYQTENLDKSMEDALGRFVMSTLPSVLEEKCGYRLFIHGRDDKPEEDSLELAEGRMKQSRRLIVILTQCEATEKSAVTTDSEMQGFDWQVGLKQTLVQKDKNVILIELEDLRLKGHARLCLNRLLHPSGPIRWQEGSQDAAAYNSYFWKRVRYLMPAVPVSRCPASALLHSCIVLIEDELRQPVFCPLLYHYHCIITSHFFKLFFLWGQRLLFVCLVVAITSIISLNHSESQDWVQDQPLCENSDMESFLLLEGEAFYSVPYIVKYLKQPLNVTWYKNASKVEFISADVKDRVHYQDSALFLLDLVPEDSGVYVGRLVEPSGQCSNAFLNFTVFKTSYKNNSDVFYGKIQTSDTNQMLSCPQIVKKTCDDLKGNFTWYKNFTLIQGEHNPNLWIMKATRRDQGIYTCVCSFTYNNRTHISSGSRLLSMEESGGASYNIMILSPTSEKQICDEGAELKLNCSVLCGINVDICEARWYINGKRINHMDGYNQSTVITSGTQTITTAFLTIHKVSAEDFLSEFKCNGNNRFKENSTTLTLERRGSLVPLLVGKLCLLCLCVFTVMLFKCFLIDLTLFFRTCVPVRAYKKDARTYDAYVVYQTENLDQATDDALGRFVMRTLPSVLEEKCSYRLFIHGRDDLPGQDLMELVEERMKESRRLMIILRLDSVSQPRVEEKATPVQNYMGGFDWQVGFHHALMQTGVKVILIQLGDTGPQGYADLPLSLQHLIRKNPPVKWPEGCEAAAALNSRFWKKVRYLMPAVPARKCVRRSKKTVPKGGRKIMSVF